jgi:hypothetical protein
MCFSTLLRKLLTAALFVLPLMLLGYLLEPVLPAVDFKMAAIMWGFAFSFGFLLMVYDSNAIQKFKHSQKLHSVGKIAYLIICPIAVSGILKHTSFDISLFFVLPLSLIAAKLLFHVDIQKILEDLFNGLWD